MASVTVTHSQLFGIKANTYKNVVYLDNHNIAYVSGHMVVLYSIHEKKQKFLSGTSGSEGVTALAKAPNNRLLAIAEKNDRGLISIFDLKTLKRRKVLVNVEQQNREYVTLEFSSDGQLLLCQGGAPEWMLTCWNWAKGRIVASVKSVTDTSIAVSPMIHGGNIPGASLTSGYTSPRHMTAHSNDTGAASLTLVSACTFSLLDPSLVCVSGNSFVRFFRLVDNSFCTLPPSNSENNTYLCHAWLKQWEDCVVAGTATGDIVLFMSGKHTLQFSTKCKKNEDSEQISDSTMRGVHSLVSTSRGLLCGLGNGIVCMYKVSPRMPVMMDKETTTAANYFVLQKNIAVESGPCRITSIIVSPTEDSLIVSPSSGQLYTVPYQVKDSSSVSLTGVHSEADIAGGTEASSALDFFLDASTLDVSLSTLIDGRSENVEYLITPFHRPHDTSNGENYLANVTGMDVCVRKPIVVTCGLDRSVRIWNYLEQTCEVFKIFTEEAHSIALHPSGFHVLVGFSDKLRLMSIMMDDIRCFKEFGIRACKECQFANGGHLFAVVNGNTIQVYNFFTCELVANLRGHNGKVRCLYWNADDSGLISAGMDGAVYQWDLDGAKREAEFIQKGIPHVSVLCSRQGSAVYAIGNDKMLKEIDFLSSQLVKELPSDVNIGQIVLSHSQRMFFASTAESNRPGTIRAYKFPLTGEFIEVQCASLPITRLRISFDDAYLFASSEDGIVAIFEIRDKDGRPRLKDSYGVGAQPGTGGPHPSSTLSTEVLVTRSDLEEKSAAIMELTHKVDELMLHNEYQLRLKDMNYNEQIKEVTEKFIREIQSEKDNFEVLRETKNHLETEYEQKISDCEGAHQIRMQEMEAGYQQAIMQKVEQYQETLHDKEQQNLKWKQEQGTLLATHKKYMTEVTADFELRLNEDRQLRMQLEEENQEVSREYVETIQQLEQDIDEEIERAKHKFESKVQAEREATLRLKGENGIMKKKFSTIQKQIDEQRDQIKQLMGKEKALSEKIKNMEKEMQAFKREIKIRDETIGEKEKRIYELKKKNQELEKFKFVLDYKIKELKQQIEPRENKITDMRHQISEMDQELEGFHKSNAQLDIMIGDQRKRIDALQEEIHSARRVVSNRKIWMERFQCDLHQAVQQIQHPTELNRQVTQLHKKYANEGLKTDDFEVEIKHEYSRQKEYLESAVHSLRQKYTEEISTGEEEYLQAIADNMLLIKEINTLRTAVTAAKSQLQAERVARVNSRNPRIKSPKSDQKSIEQIFDEQRVEIEELQRAIKASQKDILNKDHFFPPIKGIEG